jgi:hypothetical protein
MSPSDPGALSSNSGAKRDVDLTREARRFFRQRVRVAGTGVALGVGFVGIGVFEVGIHAAAGFSTLYLIALLLAFLGLALIGTSLYRGLLNPVTRIRANDSGIIFERRWGRPLKWSWKDPSFRMDIDDPTEDPVGPAESRQEAFFEGPGPMYGTMTPAALGSLLETVRAHNATITEKQLQQRERGTIHLIRRIRIRPATLR